MIKKISTLTITHFLNNGFTSYPLIYKIFIQTIYKVKILRRRPQ